MKNLALLAVAALATAAHAGPTLTADSYPSTAPQPTSAALTVNGSPGPACALPRAADGSVKPTCDLTSLAPGSYTLVLTVSNVAACSSPTSPATCTTGGSASSAPFLLTLSPGAATAPVVRIAP